MITGIKKSREIYSILHRHEFRSFRQSEHSFKSGYCFEDKVLVDNELCKRVMKVFSILNRSKKLGFT